MDRENTIRSSFPLFQLMVGLTMAVIGIVALLYTSSIWTVIEVRYAEESIVIMWGLLLVFGALRHSRDLSH